MHILGQENLVYGKPGYYRLLLIEVTMYSRTNQVKLVLLKVTMK